MATKGVVVSGEFGSILIRQKTGESIELGELLLAPTSTGNVLLQVFDLIYGSQLEQHHLELLSGIKVEENPEQFQFMDAKLRNYVLAKAKNLILINGTKAGECKTLPQFFSEIRAVEKEDFAFLEKAKNPLQLGLLRSGSRALDLPIVLDGEKALSHHVLVSGTTGRGKSVFMKNLLWQTVDKEYCGLLVLDPHDEYYGRASFGLKDNTAKEKLHYYTPNNPPPGTNTLKINIKQLQPRHFEGAADWSDAQRQAIVAYHRQYGERWIEAAVLEEPVEVKFGEGTLAVVKRLFLQLLHLDVRDKTVFCRGVFDTHAGASTISDIVNSLEKSHTVVIDTSMFSGGTEILIGSILATELLEKHKSYKADELQQKPVVSIVLEEAPRVLGKEVLEKGPNIFSTVAREGRKFRIGLIAITQLPSLIPREILANINTKVVLGIEMKTERMAIIESAAQDLSEDERMLAALDKGEAIVTSNFTKFAIPIKIPLFEEKELKREKTQMDFSGVV